MRAFWNRRRSSAHSPAVTPFGRAIGRPLTTMSWSGSSRSIENLAVKVSGV